MKIAYRRGHNFLATGARGIIDETTEAEKVTNAFEKYIKQLGHQVLDVTPENMDSDSDLVYGVSKANNWGADLFISIHFNKAFNSYQGALGTECWVYSDSDNIVLDEQVAGRIVNAIAALGFKNRGVKENTQLYELKACAMASVIVEVCFVEATDDVALYQQLGPDKIGQVIAYAAANQPIIQNAPGPIKEEEEMEKIVLYYGDVDLFSAVLVSQKNQCPLMKKSDYEAKGYNAKEIIQVGGKPEDTNRYTTAINAAQLLK